MSAHNGAGSQGYTLPARDAILAAVKCEHDFAGWLAGVLANVAAELGSSKALTVGRPGSGEASLVQQIVKGTVRWEDEFLEANREAAP